MKEKKILNEYTGLNEWQVAMQYSIFIGGAYNACTAFKYEMSHMVIFLSSLVCLDSKKSQNEFIQSHKYGLQKERYM